MSISGLLLLCVAFLAASRPAIGLLAAIGILLPFESNSLLTSGMNLITVDAYLLFIVVYCATRLLATGRIRVTRLNVLVAAICVVGILVTLIAPRLFADRVWVIPLNSVVANDYLVWHRIIRVPLQPSFSNKSQLVYLLVQFMGLACLCGLAARAGHERLTMALKLGTCVNLVLVAVSLTFGPQVLDFFFTASYVDLRDAQAFGGFRAVGGFREAARQGQFAAMCFAYFMTAYLLYSGTLNAGLAFASLTAAFLAYSSTALVGIIVALFSMLCLVTLLSIRGQLGSGTSVRVGILLGATAVGSVLLLLLGGGFLTMSLGDLINAMTIGKVASNSGIIRLAFMDVSLDVLVQTYGFGCGLGCTKGNGVWLVMAANGGLLLAFLLLLITLHVIYPKRLAGGQLTRSERFASYPALIGFLTLLACLSSSLTVPNVGILFVFSAALCWAKRAGLPDATAQGERREAAQELEPKSAVPT